MGTGRLWFNKSILTVKWLTLLLFVRETTRSSGEQHQPCLLGSARTRKLHPGRGPGERTGFGFCERRKNRERVRATAGGEAAEIFVSLADRHGHHVRGD